VGIESLLTGRILAGRYQIEEVIGRGGMGAVYRATDERLGRQVAVKVITLSGAADPAARERLQQRFLREARAAAALPHHPNVVPVYDFGTDAELGLDFLVMELLRGEDLATRLTRSGPPALTSGLHILQEATRGVAVGHRAGLVHRDVKPGNIFLVEVDGDTQVRVLDFGIAKLADDDTLSQLTQDGRVPLSPAYASPEQLRGLSRITPASDVFSLGAVGYQLLTGERPFTEVERNRMGLGMPAQARSMRERNPSVPPVIDEVIRRALAFEPEERYPDAGTLLGVLAQARQEIGGAPLPPYDVRPPSPVPPPQAAEPEQTAATATEQTEFLDDRTLLDPAAARPGPPRPPPRRQKTPLPPRRREAERSGFGTFLIALIIVLLLGAGGIFAWWTFLQPPPPVAELPPPPPDIPPIEPEEEMVEPAALALEARIQNEEGVRHYMADNFLAAREHFRQALQLAPDNIDYRYNYALTLLRLENERDAVREFRQVLRQDPERADAHYFLGEALLIVGDTAAAVAALENAVQYAVNPRERATAQGRLTEVRAAILQPVPPPAEAVPPPAETSPPGPPSGPGVPGVRRPATPAPSVPADPSDP
jgi:serine/threonine protein kinase